MKTIKTFLINGTILTITTLILKTIGMFFSIYISNKIGVESVGVFELVMSVYLFFVTFALSGINLASTRLVSEELAYGNDKNIKLVVNKCLTLSLYFGLFSAMTLFVLAPFISKNFLHNKVSATPFYVISFSLPFVSMSSCISGYFTAIQQIKKIAIVQILEQLIKINIIAYLLTLFVSKSVDFAIISLVFGTTISEIISFFMLFIFYKLNISKIKQTRYYNKGFLQKILHISIPVALTSYIRSLLSSIKQLLIPLSLEKSGISCNEALSQYGIINGIVFPLILYPSVIISSFSGLLIPEFSYYKAKNDTSKINKMLENIFKYALIFSFCIIGIFFCYSKHFSILLYKNIQISKYIKILCPIIVLMYLDNITDSILKGLDKQVKVMKINIIDLITSITFIYFLLPIKGINGYIIVIYISEFLNCLLSISTLLKTTNFKINYKKYIICPIICTILTHMFINHFINISSINCFNLIISIILFILMYLLLLHFINKVLNSKTS